MKTVELPMLAKKAGVSPIVARARLRSAYRRNSLRHLPKPIKHWLFRERDVPRVIKLIN